MADAFDLGGILEMDARTFTSGADEASQASEDVADSTGSMSESLWDVEPAGVAAGGALAGIGTAAQGLLDDTQETRESLGRTATTMGLTTDEAEDLATSMSNATFPLEDVQGAMDTLAQQGIRSEDAMRDVAESADMIADATGSTATSIAENAGPALRAMGEDVEDLGEHMDTFTWVARNTTMDVEDFSRVVTKVGPELDEMGMSVDETAAVMGALEDRGLDSRTAMREFRQAANDAEGDQEALMESLDLTTEELEAQESALEDAEGMTEDHAEAANESLSTMDELRAGFEDAKLAAADYLEPLSGLAPVAQTAGIALMGMSTINVSAVAPSFAAVATAAAPISAVILGIAAAATAAYAIWERDIGGIQAKTEAAKETIVSAVDTIVGGVQTGFDKIDYVLTEWSPMDSLRGAFDGFLDLLPSVSDVEARVNSITDPITGIPETITGTFESVWNASVGGFGLEIDGFDITIPSWVPEVGGQSYGWGGFSATIPEMATGGIVESDGLIRAGEEGPEAVLTAEQTAEVQQGEVDLGGGGTSSERVERLLEQMLQLLAGPQEISGGVQFDPSEGMLEFVDGRISTAESQKLEQFRS